MQGTQRIRSYLVNHLWQKTPTGTLLLCLSLEKLQIEAGFSSNFFETPLLSKYLTTLPWIRDCLCFTYDHDVRPQILFTPLSPRCEGEMILIK